MSQTRIRTIGPEQATGDVQQTYEMLQEHLGMVPNIFRAMSIQPPLLSATAGMVGAVLLGEGALSRADKEMIAVVVSVANRCKY
ncbi:MAG: carboxymuconolactone decarboxylase family protein [Planctomycetota bacterium]|nr:carboxymuconolactone decarboxylase family protein [Planctomycetota bacterium]MDP7131181.1 carboxymuconolactone decarboxylase family protein [Planctomycetota bacterium]MDP7251237.1 carboxymuconolactone decarboxylase family protein [Planctomycetota bacterium]